MISKEEVEHIAKLARIHLTEKEIEKFQKDFGAILDYFSILKSADTENVAPMTHSVELQNALRKDEVQKERPETVQKLIDMAPESEKGFIKVKEILSNRET